MRLLRAALSAGGLLVALTAYGNEAPDTGQPPPSAADTAPATELSDDFLGEVSDSAHAGDAAEAGEDNGETLDRTLHLQTKPPVR